MQIEDLVFEYAKANNITKPEAKLFLNWLVANKRISDFTSIIKSDSVKPIELRKEYCGKKSINRLENSDTFIDFATYLGLLGHTTESEQVFNILFTLTPEDTSALSNYGFVLLNNALKAFQTNKKYDKKTIEFAQSALSKAATIDKYLHEEPVTLPAYRNLCMLRAIDATCYFQEGTYLPAFLFAWMSIEMTTYRIFYSHLKEKEYSKGKIEELSRWNTDVIIEVLFLDRCDEKFVELKPELDALRKIRNHLIHGNIFEISENEAKRCINVALAINPIKQDLETILTK
jgi:hypothetical protein